MNRIDQTFLNKKDILNIYFTAGYPQLGDTVRIAEDLQEAGADMLEIGIPFSDPLADGPTIQQSSEQALDNGMKLSVLFDQLASLREKVTLPVLLMGYFNPIIQYGFEPFCKRCKEVGIDGLIVPDMPMMEYQAHYRELMQANGLHNIFLISPNTSEARIREIDENSQGFIYMVSSSSITGAKQGVQTGQVEYYKRVRAMSLSNPRMIGFGISDRASYQAACEHAHGAIIGSAFINQLKEDDSSSSIHHFIQSIK